MDLLWIWTAIFHADGFGHSSFRIDSEPNRVGAPGSIRRSVKGWKSEKGERICLTQVARNIARCRVYSVSRLGRPKQSLCLRHSANSDLAE